MLEQLSHYKILERMGSGSMGVVYRARDTQLGRTVAIEVLPAAVAGDAERRERFLQEAHTAARLSHPNVVALYEVGEDAGELFLVLEFIPGEALSTVIAGRALNPRRAIHFAGQVADALADAHAAGIVHRDVNPDTIVVTPKGNAKVLDLGFATWTSRGAAREEALTALQTGATSAGVAPGTVAYLSPEQARGGEVDQRSDIFSLGVVLYEMLTGLPPFQGATPAEILLQVSQSPAARPSTINKNVPRELDPIVGKALEKNPDSRFQSAATFAAELRAVDGALERRAGSAARAVAPALITRPRRTFSGWIVAVLFAGAVAALGALWYAGGPGTALRRRMFAPALQATIAVIPLELTDAEPSRRYFADGLTDDLIARLGQTTGLKVLGRSSTRDYRGRSPADLARELNAGVVLTGTVRPQGDAVNVSLELIDPADGGVVWRGQYTRELKDIFAVQAQVAADVARALKLTPPPTPSSERAASRLVDREAYDLYLRGRQSSAEHRPQQAIDFFQRAVEADAGIAEAFAGLAEALYDDARDARDARDAGGARDAPAPRVTLDDPALQQRLKSAAERAYQLDPDLPQSNLAMSLAAPSLSQSLDYLKRAVDRDPSYADGYRVIGDQILDFDPALAIDFWRRSLTFDPRMDVSRVDIATALVELDRQEDARRELSVQSASPASRGLVDRGVWIIDLDTGRQKDAIQSMRGFPNLRSVAPFWRTFAAALRTAGEASDARVEASQLVQKFPDDCEARALLGGLRAEHGQAAAGRQMAGAILQAAGEESARPSTVRCGVAAAAALSNVGSVTSLLARIATREDLLRYWSLEIDGQTGAMALRGHVYPWTNLTSKTEIAGELAEARRPLDAAYAREREVARAALAPIR
ncbi:MAG TPA: serine/threonine-protein kinase [Vicinamibacterales bacterium]|jgi:TolB-like protein|nr:serine/threonine-protein kinase [Vicinamibacterales bacterium]